MTLFTGIILAAAGYLLGSLSFARLIARRSAPGEDLTSTMIKIEGASRDFELKTISATSISTRSGPRAGCAVSLLDMAKVALPMVALKFWLFPGEPAAMLLLAAGGVLGHNYPLYHRFQGGRGLSPIMGSFLVIDWLALPVTMLASSLIGLGLFRDFMIGYAGWLFLLVPWMWWRFDHWMYPAYALFCAAAYFIASIPETRLYFEFKRAGEFDQAGSYLEAFQHTDVGRPLKYMRRYGLLRDKKIEAIREREEREGES